jgi:hypothetical protein
MENQDINIFKFLFNPKDKDFHSGHEKLVSNGFSFDSITNMSNKNFNEGINQAMSTYARMSAGSSRSTAIPEDFQLKESEVMIDPDNIEYKDIIMIAKGLIQPN